MVNSSENLGLHLIADFKAAQNVTAGDAYMTALTVEIKRINLVEVGRVLHLFDGGGFTAVSCLTESHLSVHTWPENGKVTFDVFLSNHLEVNNSKVEALWEFTRDFFSAYDLKINRIARG